MLTPSIVRRNPFWPMSLLLYYTSVRDSTFTLSWHMEMLAYHQFVPGAVWFIISSNYSTLLYSLAS